MPDENDANSMIDRLSESNRVQESRILPAAPLTAEQIAKVREDFRRYTSARAISTAHVARQVDYAETVINQWISDRYKGDNDRVTRKLNDWLERDLRRAAATRS